MNQIFDLERMLAPLSTGEFAARYFGEEPLLVHRDDNDYYAGLLGIDDFEALVFSVTSPSDSSWFHLTKNGRPLAVDPPLVDDTGDLAPSQVMASYHDGHTIILNRLQRRWEPIKSLCSALEASLVAITKIALKGDITANAYLTPADAQGFGPHSDDHDVIVIQLEGCKKWHVYSPIARYLLEASTAITPAQLARSYLDADLTAGSLLYIPRGFPHQASTSDSHSLHLTIGIHGYSYADLLSSVARAEEGLRRPLALDAADLATAAAVRKYVENIIGQLGDESWLAAARRLASSRLSHAFPASGGHLATINRLPALTAETVLTKRYVAAACRLEVNDDHVTLQFPGCVAELPLHARDVLRFILAAETFTVGALPDLPAEGEKVRLIERLAAEGLLRALDGESADLRAQSAVTQ